MPVTSPTTPLTAGLGHTATFATSWLPRSAAVITVHGDLDAATAPDFAAYARQHASHIHRLVLDLSGVDFCGTAGLSALQDIGDECVADNVPWGLTASSAVDRVLDLSGDVLPTYPTVSTALTELEGKSARSLQLITQPR
ncbi:STAS domain-containing protein [Mycobacterium sp. NPDC003449]